MQAPHYLALCTVVISSRETSSQLFATMKALLDAEPAPGVIDVLVNGNAALADAVKDAWTSVVAPATRPTRLRLWSIPLGDKAHALNEYLHRIWPGDAPAMFVDGYVRVRPDAPALLCAALASSPDALAATGVPGSGRTAQRLRRQMLEEGGLHGNCFVVGAPALAALRDTGFRLPLGMYRVDATLGAALSFGLDPARHAWQPLRFIAVEPRARWDVDARPWWRPAELRAQWRRRQRQVAGRIENGAVRNLFAERHQPPASLPATVAELVAGLQAADPARFVALAGRGRAARDASRRLLAARDWSAARLPPLLLADTAQPTLQQPTPATPRGFAS